VPNLYLGQRWWSTREETASPRQESAWYGWARVEGTGGGYYVQEQPVTMSSATMIQTEAWTAWNQYPQIVLPKQPVITPERQAVYDRERLISKNRAKARALREKQAERKAESLLLEVLDAEQAAEWEKAKSFTVKTANGDRTYKVGYGTAGNVRLVETKTPVTDKHGVPLRPDDRFCMHVYHPDGHIPHIDNMVAQKLLLESEGGEAEFLRHANVG
jgi:hypothetical protein